jgi:CheY-like chemotaxis protein
VLELLAATLVWKGFRVLRETDGQTGVETALNCQPDAIILDLAMPGPGGAKMVEQLRADARTRSTPILIHTGIGLDGPERQRLASQVQAITFKTEQETLFAELERLETPAQESLEMEPRL